MCYMELCLFNVEQYKVLSCSVCFRRYTKFYGTSEKAAQTLAHDALTSKHL